MATPEQLLADIGRLMDQYAATPDDNIAQRAALTAEKQELVQLLRDMETNPNIAAEWATQAEHKAAVDTIQSELRPEVQGRLIPSPSDMGA